MLENINITLLLLNVWDRPIKSWPLFWQWLQSHLIPLRTYFFTIWETHWVLHWMPWVFQRTLHSVWSELNISYVSSGNILLIIPQIFTTWPYGFHFMHSWPAKTQVFSKSSRWPLYRFLGFSCLQSSFLFRSWPCNL